MTENINRKITCPDNVSFVNVEYPGIVQNEEKMLETLGGLTHIQKVYNDPSKRLDLKFRPKDPCCKPVCADRSTCTSLLLKVSKYRRKSKDNSSNSTEEFKYKQEIVGVIDDVFTFTSLCDFQYLPTIKDKETGDFINMIPYLTVDKLHRDRKVFTREAPLFIPPPIFARLDTPQDYDYKNSVKLYKACSTTSPSKIGVSRPHRFHNASCCTFEDRVPTEPLPPAVKFFESHSSFLGALKEKLAKLFEEQPIWSKNALLVKMGTLRDSLKNLLPLVAYYVFTGPWRCLWIRFGYDPKEHPEAKKYQLIDFRVRRGMHTPHIPIKAKRSTFSYKLPNLQTRGKNVSNSSKSVLSSIAGEAPTETASASTSSTPPSGAQIKTQVYDESYAVYREGRLPPHRQMFYMACNVLLPEAERLVSQTNSDAVCTKENGWFPPKTTTQVREIITKDVFRTISKLKKESEKGAEGYHSAWKKKSAALSLASQNKDDSQDTGETSDGSDEEETTSGEQTTQDEELDEELNMDVDDEEDDKDELEAMEDGGWYFDEEDK